MIGYTGSAHDVEIQERIRAELEAFCYVPIMAISPTDLPSAPEQEGDA